MHAISIKMLIPTQTDSVANRLNIAAIDRLVKTDRYRFVVAWGKWLGFTAEAVKHQVQQAEADDAPEDAIQKSDNRWLSLSDIQCEENVRKVRRIAEASALRG